VVLVVVVDKGNRLLPPAVLELLGKATVVVMVLIMDH
jgi:hypothetical protein